MTSSKDNKNSNASSECGCVPHSNHPCHHVEFGKWLEQQLLELEREFKNFTTRNSVLESISR